MSGSTHAVDPARLKWGTWCHSAEKQLGEGDIAASYSADRIGMGNPVRKPFGWKGSLWVCVALGCASAKVYRLALPQNFSGTPLTYHDRVIAGDEARKDPNGFYHGVAVNHGGKTFVLCGPPAVLVPGEPEQMDLFAGLP
jgi:hypothetical protein